MAPAHQHPMMLSACPTQPTPARAHGRSSPGTQRTRAVNTRTPQWLYIHARTHIHVRTHTHAHAHTALTLLTRTHAHTHTHTRCALSSCAQVARTDADLDISKQSTLTKRGLQLSFDSVDEADAKSPFPAGGWHSWMIGTLGAKLVGVEASTSRAKVLGRCFFSLLTVFQTRSP
jgi:hypothetical protein